MKTYRVLITITDTETNQDVFCADVPSVPHSDLYEPGAATPGLKPVSDFLQRAVTAMANVVRSA